DRLQVLRGIAAGFGGGRGRRGPDEEDRMDHDAPDHAQIESRKEDAVGGRHYSDGSGANRDRVVDRYSDGDTRADAGSPRRDFSERDDSGGRAELAEHDDRCGPGPL